MFLIVVFLLMSKRFILPLIFLLPKASFSSLSMLLLLVTVDLYKSDSNLGLLSSSIIPFFNKLSLFSDLLLLPEVFES